MSNKYKIKRKIFVPFVTAIIILIGSFFVGINYLMQTEIDVVTKSKVEYVSEEFDFQQDKDVELMNATIVALQQDRELQKYWLKKDREKLLEKSQLLFRKIQERVNITHFYFHDVSAINFLRVHNPEKHGDLIDRYTMRDAKELLIVTSGIEIGPYGSFSLRVVVPWFIEGKLEGFIELGEEIEHITEHIHTTGDVELLILYKKQFITRDKYKKVIGRYKNAEDWDKFKNWVMVYNTQNWVPEKILPYDVDNLSDSFLLNNQFRKNNNDYIVKSLIIRDAGQREVAVLMIVIDSTIQFGIIRNISYLISGIVFVIGFILFAIFYFVINQTEKNLIKSQNKITDEVKKREKIQKTYLGELVKEKEKLQESEERFKTIVTYSVPIIFMFDKQGVIQLSEGKMLNNLGLKPGEVVGQNVFQLYKDFPNAISVFKNTLEGETFEGILEIKGRFLESFVSPIKDSEGNIVSAIGISLDITDRKETADRLKKQTEDLEKSNKELKKSRMAALSIMQDANIQKGVTEKALLDLEKTVQEYKKLSRAIEQAPVTVVITNLSGAIEYVNPNFSKVTGYSAEEALGNNPRILKSGGLSQAVYSGMWETLVSNKIWRGELENKKKSGEIYWESVSISPINDSKGEITHYVAVKEDITERRKNEIELREAKITAEVATEAKSRFLASMSHEIRTPMNAILGFSYLTLNTSLTTKQLDYITKIDGSAKSLLKIINDILDFSKIEAGELDIEAIDFNLEDVITSVSNVISHTLFEKELELITYISPNVPIALVGDPLRIGQILTNFCNNAVKFTSKGKIVLEVTFVTEVDNSVELLFAVKDTGVGIKEEKKNKLFNAFQQADTSTTREFGGTGLGLVISENLAKLMNGDIWFESEENVGSTFFFSAKLEKQKIERNEEEIAEEFLGTKVLLFNTTTTTNMYLSEVLEYFSFKVDSVSSEREARKLLAQSNEVPYKLVITECRDLVTENIKTLELIKNKYNIPILMLISPYQQEKIVDIRVIETINSFLVKPFNNSDLFNAIMGLFGNTSSNDIAITEEKIQDYAALEKIRGSLILLAEDNKINQQLTVEMFKTLDIRVEIANNGLQAVKMVKNSGTPSKYSLVLMDIQMPEMDGYNATTEIKKLKKYKNIPIIAMTADAMSDVKEKCFSVGMVDYLTKPIVPQKVIETMVKWIKPKNELATNKPKPYRIIKKLKNVKNIDLPQIDGVNINDALKYVGGDKQLLISLLKKFLYNSNFEERVNKAVNIGDRDEIIRIIHTLKGNAGLLGMNELKEVTDNAQSALLNDKSIDVNDFVPNILYKLLPIITSLKIAFSNKEDTGNNKLRFIEEVEEKLKKLKSLLELHDMEAVRLIGDIGSIIGFEEEVMELNKNINNYQFEKALEILQKIK